MKKHLRNFVLLLTVFLFILSEKSNAQTLAIVSDSLSQYSTNFGSSDTLTYTLENTGTKSFLGSPTNVCTIYCKVDTGPVFILDTTTSHILPGGTKSFSYIFSITKVNSFHSFTNIIVIWPYTNEAGVICDTSQVNVYVNSPAGITELKTRANGFVLYPNPANTLLQLLVINPGLTIEILRVYNSVGELLSTYTGNIRQLNTEALPNGLYILQIESSDHQTSNLRFIKQ